MKRNSLANTGNAISRCMGSHISAREPPTVDKGASPKNPARKRQASWLPIFWDRPAPIINSEYIKTAPR